MAQGNSRLKFNLAFSLLSFVFMLNSSQVQSFNSRTQLPSRDQRNKREIDSIFQLSPEMCPNLLSICQRIEENEACKKVKENCRGKVHAIEFDAGGNCEGLAKNGNCEFYRCYEEKKQCGASGYLLGYGYKYCARYKETYSQFTPEGKRWMNCVRQCLTHFLLFYPYRDDAVSCDQMRDAAIRNHVTCYLNCGFCKICKTDKTALLATFDLQDVSNAAVISKLWDTLAQCPLQGINCFV